MRQRRKPETLRLRKLTPSFTVGDLQRSLAFYRDVLGFLVTDTWEDQGEVRGAALKAGSVEIYLTQDDFAKGRERRKGEGFRLRCTTAQDLDELAAGIEARGGKLAEPVQDRPWGTRDFAVVDPDGFKLSFTVATS
jgi:uncharacterized glyoxalase superfamily protein PhnB